MTTASTDIRSVHLIGLGAVGAVYASLLHDLDPAILTVIADQARKERHRANSLALNDRFYAFNYRDPADASEPADLLIVAVKQHQLDEAIRDMARSVGPRTVILSLLNGITSEEILGARFGMEKLLFSFCVGTDATRTDDRITYTKIGTVVFGERTGSSGSERVERVRRLFERAGIPYSIPEDMMRELWWKFMMNVGINAVSAILRAPYGVFRRITEARELFSAAAREAVELAQTEGVELTEADIEKCLAIFETLSPSGKTSMFQDVEAGRKTEIELFAGTVVELGKKHHIATPVNYVLLRMLRILERMYSE